jgi:hypothetical protein
MTTWHLFPQDWDTHRVERVDKKLKGESIFDKNHRAILSAPSRLPPLQQSHYERSWIFWHVIKGNVVVEDCLIMCINNFLHK